MKSIIRVCTSLKTCDHQLRTKNVLVILKYGIGAMHESDSLEEAMLLVKKYEQETTTKFSCYKSDKMFGSGGKTFSSR